MKIQSYGFFLLRRPLLSIDDLHKFHDQIQSNDAAFETQLTRIFQDPVLLEAIHLASPSLYRATLLLLTGNLLSGKQKLLISLYKYYIRMCTRCTPFGLFAGYALGELKDQTRIIFNAERSFEKHSTLDSRALTEIARSIQKNQRVQNQIRYYPNSSLYQAADNLRYIKTLTTDQNTEFILTQIPWSMLLSKLLDTAKDGITLEQLDQLLGNLGIAKARALSKSLIERQLLVSELEVNLTGADFFHVLKSRIEGINTSQLLKKVLNKIDKALKAQDSSPLIQKAIGKIGGVSTETALIQTDIRFNTVSCQLSQRTVGSIITSIEKISCLTRTQKAAELKKFAKDLHERFGQQAVPVLFALDYDYGVGYGSLSSESQYFLPLLEGLPDKGHTHKNGHKNSPLINCLYEMATSENLQTIELTDQLLNRHCSDKTEFGESFYLFGSMIAASQRDLDQGDFLFDLIAVSGPSAISLLTRFAQADGALNGKIQKITATRQGLRGNTVFAEIVHAPGPGAANILRRPDLGDYEIPYLAKSTKPEAHQIPMQDLLVSSPDGKNIRLVSKRLKKQIIPTLTSAHNYRQGLPAYRFLCDLSAAENRFFQWSWQGFSESRFLPRVQYKNLILSKASWLLDDQDLADFQNQNESVSAWWQKIQARYHIPRYFQIGHSDNTLFIDSQSTPALELTIQMLRKRGSLRLTECPDELNTVLQINEKSICNEIIIPLCKKSKPEKADYVAEPYKNKRRNFALGSPWLFVKIYCSERLSDEIIRIYLGPLCHLLQKEKKIEKWFFVRYQDPKPHIRLRLFNSKDPGFWKTALDKLNAMLNIPIQNGTIHKVQTDHYQRELERYGSLPYEKIESIFHADSEAVYSYLNYLSESQNPDLGWLAPLRGTDMLLTDLGLDLTGKIRIIESACKQFSAELDANGALKVRIDQNYRNKKSIISNCMGHQISDKKNSPDQSELHIVLEIFQLRSKQIRSILTTISAQSDSSRQALAGDLIHMFLNRCFFSQQRTQEMVIYNYLKKYYSTIINCNHKVKKVSQSLDSNH